EHAEPGDRGAVGVEVGGDAPVVELEATYHLDSHPSEMAARSGDREHTGPRGGLVLEPAAGRGHEPDLVEAAQWCVAHVVDGRFPARPGCEERDDVAGENRDVVRAGEDDRRAPAVLLPWIGPVERLLPRGRHVRVARLSVRSRIDEAVADLEHERLRSSEDAPVPRLAVRARPFRGELLQRL